MHGCSALMSTSLEGQGRQCCGMTRMTRRPRSVWQLRPVCRMVICVFLGVFAVHRLPEKAYAHQLMTPPRAIRVMLHSLETENNALKHHLKSVRRKAAVNACALSNVFHNVADAQNTIADKDAELASMKSQLEQMQLAMAAAEAERAAQLAHAEERGAMRAAVRPA